MTHEPTSVHPTDLQVRSKNTKRLVEALSGDDMRLRSLVEASLARFLLPEDMAFPEHRADFLDSSNRVGSMSYEEAREGFRQFYKVGVDEDGGLIGGGREVALFHYACSWLDLFAARETSSGGSE